MAIEKIARKIPESLWKETSEKLIDIILNSPNADRLPSDLAKTILYYWQRDQLTTEVGLQRLLEAAIIVDPEKTVEVLDNLGLQNIVAILKETA